MNKKFLSAVLFGAFMLGSSVTFTGCIDNDEPAGIEELRGAKAELISAKAAVERAIAAQEEAKAIAEQAKAEMEQVKLEIEKLQVAVEQAKAEAAIAQSAADKAAAEQRIAEIELQIAEAAKVSELTMLQIENAIAEQKRQLAIALKNLALAEKTLTAEQKAYLAPYVAAVKQASDDLDEETKELEAAIDTYTKYLTQTERGKKSQFYMYQERKDSIEAEAKYAAAVEAEAIAKAAAESTSATEEKWGEELEGLNDKKEALDKELADAHVALEEYMATEAIRLKKDSAKALGGQYEAMTGKVWSEGGDWFDADGEFEFAENGKAVVIDEDADDIIELEDVVLEYDNVLGMFGFTGSNTIEGSVDYSEYLKAKEAGTLDEFIIGQEAELQGAIDNINKFRLTANGEAWTEHAANLIEFKAKEIKAAYDLDKPMWEKLVYSFTNFYGLKFKGDNRDNEIMNVTGFASSEDFANYFKNVWLNNYVEQVIVADISQYDEEGYGAIKDAVDAYNAAVEEFNAAVDSLEAFVEEKSAIEDAVRDSIDALDAKEFEARLKYSKELKDFIDAQDNKQTELFYNMKVAAQKLENAEYNGTATKADTTASENAKKAYEAFVLPTPGSAYRSAKDSLIKAAIAHKDSMYNKVSLETLEASILLWQAFHKENDPSITEYRGLLEAKDVKGEALADAVDDVEEAVDDFNENVPFAIYFPTFLDNFYDNFNEEEERLEPLPCEDINEFAGGDYIDVYQALDVTSEKLFGENLLPYLVELTEEEMLALIEKEIAEETAAEESSFPFPRLLTAMKMREFGLFGQEKALLELAQIGRDAIANKAELDELVAELEGYIKNIYAQIEAFEAEVAEVEKAFWALHAEIVLNTSEFQNNIDAITERIRDTKTMIRAIEQAIWVYLGYETDGEGNTLGNVIVEYVETEEGSGYYYKDETEIETIEDLKEYLNKLYKKAQKKTERAKLNLMAAIDRMEMFKNGELDADAEALAKKEKAQKEFDAASAKLEAAQKALEDALNRIGAEYDPSFEIGSEGEGESAEGGNTEEA